MVENLIETYFSSEIDINIDMKFDQALKTRIILEYTGIRIIIYHQYLPVSVNGVSYFSVNLVVRNMLKYPHFALH